MDDFDEEGDELLSAVDIANPESDPANKGSKFAESLQDSTSNKPNGDDDCEIPESFPFPFEPYDIQKGFMEHLYKCLTLGKVGIFESPTGTGKSLSLICGALKWLRDYQEKQRAELEELMAVDTKTGAKKEDSTAKNTGGELDWVAEYAAKKEKEESLKHVKIEQEQALKRESRLKQVRTNKPHLKGKRKRDKLEDEFDELMKEASSELKEAFNSEISQVENSATDGCHGDEDLVLLDYHSDDDDTEKEAEDLEEEEHVTKIYFCSRTHSQLSQFVREIIRSPYGENTYVTSLGSRQSLCINESVKKLKSLSLMNDRCLELQKNKNSSKSGTSKSRKTNSNGCQFYKQTLIQDFRDRSLLDIGDIEQLVKLGREMKACPYFGTRYAIPSAEVVALPYNTLLHHSTREACGIKLKGNVVVIDEAHNLLETINNIYSTEITGAQVLRAHSQLSQYESKFRSRLKAKNLMYVKQLLFVLASLVKFLGGKLDVAADKQVLSAKEACLMTINDFLFKAHLDNMNLFKVLRYCQRSNISRKLNGFVEKYQIQDIAPVVIKKEKTESGLSNFLKEINKKPEQTDINVKDVPAPQQDNQPVLKSPLMHIEGFLEALTNADKDGRIVLSVQNRLSQSCLKFLLLNPAVHFHSVVKEARAIVVAGGTMQPISEFKQQLFYGAGVSPDRILEFSCGHVIESSHILPLVVSAGPTDHVLEFTYQNRDRPQLLDELGRVVVNTSQIVPGGLVIFFPSYDYEKKVHTYWESSGVLKRITARKRIFREPKMAGMVDATLSEFSKCIKFATSDPTSSLTGAILLCVVGGKMSEGINFSDDLARCIIMVGLPYPNMYSPELKEKMDYLNKNYPKSEDGKMPGQVHYENICMKAVNQSIGRAIRHRGDYASILLCDRRYGAQHIVNKLPTWIAKRLTKTTKFGPVMASVSRFFAEKKKLEVT